MADKTGGMGAEVGLRKMNQNGEVVQEEGVSDSGYSRTTWVIFVTMVVLDIFGLFKVLEIIGVII